LNAWFCLQGSVEIDNAAGNVTVGVDGTTVLTVSNVDTVPSSNSVTRAELGIGWIEDQTTAEVYVDNIVVDTAPVPCL
jgi:hypothetical protein